MDAIKALFPKPRRGRRPVPVAVVIAMAVSAGFLYPRDPLALAGRPLIWPFSNPRFLLGTDNSGREFAAQIFYGARISLLIGGVATAIAILIGILVGAFAGYYGGWVDNVLMRITGSLPDAAELRAPAGAGCGIRLDLDYRHHRGRCGVVAGTGAADPSRIPLAAHREFVQAGRTLGMKDVQFDPWRNPAQRAAAGHRPMPAW